MWFFLKENFGHADKFMLSPTWKGFNFFCLFKKKTEHKSDFTNLWKISNLIHDRFNIPSESCPHPSRLKGEGNNKKGEGGPFRNTYFQCVFLSGHIKENFSIFFANHTPRSKLSFHKSRPPRPPPAQFRNIWTLPNFGLETSKIAVSTNLCCFIRQHTWLKTYVYLHRKMSQNILDKSASNIFSPMVNIFSLSKTF